MLVKSEIRLKAASVFHGFNDFKTLTSPRRGVLRKRWMRLFERRVSNSRIFVASDVRKRDALAFLKTKCVKQPKRDRQGQYEGL